MQLAVALVSVAILDQESISNGLQPSHLDGQVQESLAEQGATRLASYTTG